MQPLSAAQLLAVWEQGIGAPPQQQALALLAAAIPEQTPASLAQMSIGQRDALLLQLRAWTFGPHLTSIADCPECAARLELAFAVADLLVTPLPEMAATPQTHALQVNGYALQYRLPNSDDLMAVAAAGMAEAQQLLLGRCLLQVEHEGAPTLAATLPAVVTEAVIADMAETDPQADVQMTMTCPECDHQWGAPFDIVTFFWGEIEAWARRLLRQVHTLAGAYGWREADILALSARRRNMYLELLGL